MMLDDDERPSF